MLLHVYATFCSNIYIYSMYRYKRVIIFKWNSTIKVDFSHHEKNFIQRLGNVFKINLILVHRISAESTKTPVCKQLSRLENEPTHFHNLNLNTSFLLFLKI